MHRRSGRLAAQAVIVVFACLVSLTCHVTDVTGPATVRDVRVAFDGDSTVVMGARQLAIVRATAEGAPIVRPHIRLVSSDTLILAISAGGDSVIGRRLGKVTLTAQLQGSLFPDAPPAASRTVRVVPARFLIAPAALQFDALGDTVPVSVVAYDAQNEIIPGVKAFFSVANTAIATVANFRVASVGGGTTELRAAMTGVDTARATITVAQKLDHFTFGSPPIDVVSFDALGEDTTLVATARDRHGNAMPGVPVWESADSTRVRVSPGGVARSLANGVTWALARHPDGRADSLRLVVDQRATSVRITASTTLISSQAGQISLVGRGYDRNGQFVTDDTPFWSSLAEDKASVDPPHGRVAVVTGNRAGSATIVAMQDGVADSLVVTVINDPASIAVRPRTVTLLSAGDQFVDTATVRNASNGIIDSASVSWSTSDPTVATVNQSGLVTAVDSGRARISAQVQQANGNFLADTTTVTVTNTPVTVKILLAEDTLTYIGDTLTVPARILNARDNPLARTRVHWIARQPGIVSVSSTGQVSALAVGTTYVVAAADSGTPWPRDSMRVTVTNLVASVAIDGMPDGAVDTLPALGDAIPYTATVWGTSGLRLTSYPRTWTSTSPAVVTVSNDGIATATGFGFASIVVRAAGSLDTVRIVVRRPSRMHVDNRRAGTPALGTLAHPLPSITAGVGRAGAGDTILVASGAPYAENVTIPARLTILGDSTAYVSSGRNPSALVTLLHQTAGPAMAISAVPATVRYVAIMHSVSGPAISATDADVDLSSIFVNPGRTDTPLGSGILVQRAPFSARLDRSSIESVRGYGVRIVNSGGARVTLTRVVGIARDSVVGSPPSTGDGAGIAIFGGRGPLLSSNTLHGADGTQILLSATVDAAVSANIVTGERQLALVTGATGVTTVTDNSFDQTRISSEPFTGNSTTDGRSGLEVNASSGVQIERNQFRDRAGTASLMDAMHFADARALRLDANDVTGGRRAVRSERSTWTLMRTHIDTVATAIEALGSDSITLSSDTILTTSVSCLSARSAALQITSLRLDQCGVGDAPALGVVRGSLRVEDLDMRGTNPRAIAVDSASVMKLHRVVLRGPLAGTVGIVGLGGIEAAADSIAVTTAVITGFSDRAAVHVTGVTSVRIDSITANSSRYGIVVAGTPASIDVRTNDIADADSAGLVMRPGATVTVPDVWWGDGRGPAGTSTTTVGDTIIGPVVASAYRTAALRVGSLASVLRMLRGDGQSAPAGGNLPLPFSVRVVDTDGLPVKGVTVKFTIPTSSSSTFTNGLKTINVITNDAGISEALMRVKGATQTVVTVTATGVANSLTFTATGT